jgi:hypothetical protein
MRHGRVATLVCEWAEKAVRMDYPWLVGTAKGLHNAASYHERRVARHVPRGVHSSFKFVEG